MGLKVVSLGIFLEHLHESIVNEDPFVNPKEVEGKDVVQVPNGVEVPAIINLVQEVINEKAKSLNQSPRKET